MSVWRLTIRYLAYHRGKTLTLVLAIFLVAYLPLAVHLVLHEGEQALRMRAVSTPLVAGAPGSRADLTFSALYFLGRPPGAMAHGEAARMRETGWASVIPLHVGHRARGFPVVGAPLDYLDFRGLEVTRGTAFVRLGDCVLGARVAAELGLGPGDRLKTDPENVFNIAGEYPLNMRVTGVLSPRRTADDGAVFVDVKTAWVISGLGHGHQDVTQVEDEALVLDRTDEAVVASAALMHYMEINEDNIGSFHFHGDTAEFPIHAMVAVPHGEKETALLLGRYETEDQAVQLFRPIEVIDEVMGVAFRVKRIFDANVALVSAATILLLVLILWLSLRLRRDELETMFRIGGSRGMALRLVSAEFACYLAVGLGLAGAAAWGTLRQAPALLHYIL